MKIRSSVLLILLGTLFISTEAKVLDTLVIEGLSINSPGVVRNALEIREKREFTPSDIQESLRRLYALGLFKSIDFLILNENDSSASLKLSLVENSICENIEYSGNKKLKVKDFEEKLTLKKGQILTDVLLLKNEQILRSLYAEKGYNLVDIKTEQINTKIPGNVILKFSIKENAKVRIANIVFSGNKQIPSSKILRKFKTKEHRWWRGGEFKQDVYKAHLDTLIMFYNDLGYLDASVVKDSVWYSDNKKDLNINIALSEGTKYVTGDFFFKGNKILETDSLKTKIALKAGKPFQKSRFELTKYMVENAYREEGYLWVQVNDERTFRGDTIDVSFDISEGRAAIVRRVDIKGNNKTMEKVIRRELSCLPGKKYKQSLMMRSRQNLMALNFFGDVKPDLIPNEDGTIDLVFDVTEKDNIGQLQIGAAYSMTDKFVGTFSTSIPNFRGAGQELRVNLEYGENKRNVTLGFTEPWAFDKPLALSSNVFYKKSTDDDDDTSRTYGFNFGGTRSRLKWPDDRFRLTASYQLSYEESSRDSFSDPANRLLVIEDGWMSKLSLGVQRYDLDVPLFPTKGSKFSIISDIAGLGGTYKYLKGTLSYEHYFPLPYKFVLGSRSEFGMIRGFGNNDVTISYSDLFKIGGVYGDGDLRGYEDYQFGGWNNDGQEATGLNMFTSTLELRYPILDQQLYVAAFMDCGNTWKRVSDINLTDVYKSVGVGIRLNLPMLGLIGFDFGYGLDYPSDDPYKKDDGKWKMAFLMNRGF
jgi:outer membrane protein insertion porin family